MTWIITKDNIQVWNLDRLIDLTVIIMCNNEKLNESIVKDTSLYKFYSFIFPRCINIIVSWMKTVILCLYFIVSYLNPIALWDNFIVFPMKITLHVMYTYQIRIENKNAFWRNKQFLTKKWIIFICVTIYILIYVLGQ